MKVFVFGEVAQLTNRYHGGGGLVVIARDRAHVEEILADHPNVVLTEREWVGDERWIDLSPGVQVYELSGEVEPRVFIFPDSGCC